MPGDVPLAAGEERRPVEGARLHVHQTEELHLLERRPDQHGDLARETILDRGEGVARDDFPVDHRHEGEPEPIAKLRPGHRARGPRESRGDRPLGLEEPGRRELAQALGRPGCEPESTEERLGYALRILAGGHEVRRPALQDRAAEEPAGPRHAEEGRHADRARRLAEDRDLRGVAAEGRDLLPHPLERRHLVEDPLVSGRRQPLAAERLQVEEAEHAEAIVERDDDHVAASGEDGTVVDRLGARTDDEAAAVDPDEDGPARPVEPGGPDVQREAVLVHRTHVEGECRAERARALPGRRSEAGGVAEARPGRERSRREEAARAHRRRGVRDAAKDMNAVLEEAPELPAPGLDDHAHGRSAYHTSGRAHSVLTAAAWHTRATSA